MALVGSPVSMLMITIWPQYDVGVADKICSNISSSLFTIKRLSNIIEQDVLITDGDHVPKSIQKEFLYYKTVIRYITGLKQTNSCRGSFIRLKIVTLYSLYIYIYIYIYEKILLVRDNHQLVHNREIYNCRQTTARGKFYNRLPAYIKLIKDNLLFRRQLK
jgi:hypothetical protein